jgi:hypothetical protein
MKKFNHAFDIAFSIESDNVGEEVTAAELKAGLAKRLADLLASDDVEIIESCGLPYDTYENEMEEV